MYPVRILKSTLPADTKRDLLAITDWLVEHGRDAYDYSPHLAGKIARGAQLRIPPPGPDRRGLHARRRRVFDFYLALALAYRAASRGAVGSLEVDDSWVVSQHAADHNPVHGHDGLISGVIYLQVPPQIDATRSPAGCLCFHHTDPSKAPPHVSTTARERMAFVASDLKPTRDATNAVFRVHPVAGDVYLFPSWLLHEVPAFRGGGERRSVSFNVRVSARRRRSPRTARLGDFELLELFSEG